MSTSKGSGTAQSDLRVQSFTANEVHSVLVQCHVCRIQLVGTPGNEIRISWRDTNLRKMSVQMQGGTLEVKERDRVAIYELFGLLELSRDKELLIEIPRSYIGSVRLNTVGETIECGQIGISGSLEIHTKTGAVRLRDIQADCVSVEAEHGNIQAFGIAVNKGIMMSSVNGGINCEAYGRAEEYSISCCSQYGKCTVPQIPMSGSKNLRFDSLTGNINVSFIES